MSFPLKPFWRIRAFTPNERKEMKEHSSMGVGRIMVAMSVCLLAMSHVAVAAPYVKQSAERVAQIAQMLPEKLPVAPSHISNRAAWDRHAARRSGRDMVKRAENIISMQVPECPDSLYLEFTKNGNRTHYQAPYFQRTVNLKALVIAECLENKGRFMPKIVEYVDAICAERTWTMPAHDIPLKAFNGEWMNVDLGASHRAENCSWILAALKGVLPEATAAKMRAELERRIFAPVRRICGVKALSECRPMWWFQGKSNWTAVCQSCVVRSALLVVEDRTDRAVFIEGAERSVPGFLSGFTDDGYCTEGIGYWNYGFGNFLSLSIAVREATGGKLDFCASDKAKKVMEYGTGILVAGEVGAPIADGGGRLAAQILQLGHVIWPEMPMTKSAMVRRPFVGGIAEMSLLDFGLWDRLQSSAVTDYPAHTEFPIAQMFILRPGKSAMPFRIGLKGGRNDDFHNHNDVGTYALFIDDVQLSGDPGGIEYTAKTFGPQRYEDRIINSYGHPVPVLDGALQKPGAKYRGKVVATSFSDDVDAVTLDIAGAYDAKESKVKSLVRTFVYDRVKKTVSVTDKVEFVSPATFSVPILTAGTLAADGADRYVLSVPFGKKDETLSASVAISVEGSAWKIEEDHIDNPGRISPNRYAITLTKPVQSAEVTVTYALPVK